MTNRETALARLRARAAQQRAAREDPRYALVIGRLVELGLLHAAEPAQSQRRGRGKLRLDDMLWVGEVEPRVLEVLPALLLEKPDAVRTPKALPEDLARAVEAVRLGLTDGAFRGLPWNKLARHVVRARGAPRAAKLHAVGLRREDEVLLERLSHALSENRTDVIRLALRTLARHELQ